MNPLQEARIEKDAANAVRDPLSEVTRRERRLLLAVSTVCFAVSKAGLVPTKISALGIDFTQSDQKAIFLILGAIVVYLLLTFVAYAAADFIQWRIATADSFRAWWNANLSGLEEAAKAENVRREQIKKQLGLYFPTTSAAVAYAGKVSVLRAFIEFFFPALFGGYCAYLMFAAKP